MRALLLVSGLLLALPQGLRAQEAPPPRTATPAERAAAPAARPRASAPRLREAAPEPKAVAPKPRPRLQPRKKPPAKGFSWKVTFDMQGHYTARMMYINNLADLTQSFLPTTTGQLRERLKHTLYFTHHLRFEPRLSLGKLATLHVRLDGLQHVVWGDNDARAQSPLFAGTPTHTNDYGESNATIGLLWAYLDLDLKLGKLRVGRMASNWGMGLVSNGGGDLTKFRGGVDDMFGDNRHPSIYDRVLFATKPLSVVKALMKKKDITSHFILAYAYDRLVEEPFWKDLDADLQRPYGEQTFLSRQLNNVDEHVLVLAYSNPEFIKTRLKQFTTKQLTLGIYMVYRQQGAIDGIARYYDGNQYIAYDCEASDPPPACGANSKVGIIDPYFRLRLGPWLVESEGYVIFGKTEPGRGIPIGDDVEKALIYGWVARLGYLSKKGLDVLVDFGQASGDSILNDATYAQRPLHPDHRVGLILYPEFLRERTATALAQRLTSNVGGTRTPARGLQSNGGVINSTYIYPRFRFRMNRLMTLKLAVVSAWSHRQDEVNGYLFPVRGPGNQSCEKGAKGTGCRAKWHHIGTEIDWGVDIHWGGQPGLEHLFFRLDMGYMIFGKQVSMDYDAAGIFALQMRLMMVF